MLAALMLFSVAVAPSAFAGSDGLVIEADAVEGATEGAPATEEGKDKIAKPADEKAKSTSEDKGKSASKETKKK